MQCVHQVFESVAIANADRTAVVCGERRLTYSELNCIANRIAHLLLNRGLRKEELVAVMAERSAETIATILGILKAGGAYLPLDARDPVERRNLILADSGSRFMITDGDPGISRNGDISVIDMKLLDFNGADPGNPAVGMSPDSLAYVMFTSGSTGVPKGVMIEHRSITRLVLGESYADFGPEHVFLQFAPLSFDASTFEIWGALLNGGRLSVMPACNASLADLGTVIRNDGVTTIWLTAGLFHVMVDERLDDLRPIRQLLAGGDVLSPTHVRKALDELDCEIINGYGPTENTTFTCCYRIPKDADPNAAIPVGSPVAGSEIVILDDSLRPVADGETGEMFIGGDGLARGYLNRPDLTEERFVEVTFDDGPTRLYRSGDRCRRLPNGIIEFLGRTDAQVKIRGFRIELEELEQALKRQPGVRDAAACVKGRSSEEKRIVAFILPEFGTSPDLPSIRSRLASVLPDYMVPAVIGQLDSFPLNRNGKVDREALASYPESEESVFSSFVKPETETEKTVVRSLEAILGTNRVGATDNFFDLGANSLQIARLHQRLSAEFGPRLKILSFYRHPTVRSLAAFLNEEDAVRDGIREASERASRRRSAYIRQRRIRQEEF